MRALTRYLTHTALVATVAFAVARASVSALALLKGEGVTLSVGATGSDVAYQWFYRSGTGGDWSPLAGATGATLRIASAWRTRMAR